MGREKTYSGYKSYQYLEPGIDYKEFQLREPIIKEWDYRIPLSKTEEERYEDIMEKNIVMDLHAHAVMRPEDSLERPLYEREGRDFTPYEALSQSGLDCVFDNMMNGSCFVNTKHGWDWTGVIHDLGMRLCDFAHQDFIIHCKKVDDIITAHKTGKLAWVSVIESASCIENEVDRLDVLYGLGVRSIGICYSESNMLGTGLKELRDGGLTDFGYDAVNRMNKIGMLIDVSHTSDQTALDTIELSKKPIIVSHCGVRELSQSTRMFPAEVIKALGEKEGVMAIEAAPNTTVTTKNPVHSIESFMEHIEYCIELIGIDYVGCGPDTNYADHVGMYIARIETSKTEGLGHVKRPGSNERERSVDVLKKLKYVKGMENPTDGIQNVARWMILHGYSDEEIAKIIGLNGLKLLKKVW